jgi:hypothetical protein
MGQSVVVISTTINSNNETNNSTSHSPFYSTTYSPMTSSPSKVPPGNFSSWDTVSCYFSDPKYYNLTGNITYRNCVETGRNSSNCTFYSSSYQQATIEINGVMCSYGWCSLYGPSSINSNYSMSYDVYIGNCQEYSSTTYSPFYSTTYSPMTSSPSKVPPGNFSSWDTVSCYFSDPKYYNLTGNITYRNCVETGRNSSNCTFYSSSYQQATIEINGVMCSYGWCSLYGPSSINSNYSMSYDVYIGNCQEYSSTTYSPFYSTTYSPMTSSPSKVPPGNFSSWDTVSCYFSDPKYYNLTGNITYRNCVETGRNSSNCTFYSSSYQQATIEINGVMCSYGWCSLYGPSSINSNYSMSYDVYIGNCQEYSSTTYSPFYSTTYSPMTSSPSKVPPGNFSSWDTVSCYFSDPKYYNLTGNITYRNCVETGRNSSNCTFYSSSYQQATIEINGVMCSYGWCSLYGPSSINSNYSMSYDVYIGNCQEYSSTTYSPFYSTTYSPMTSSPSKVPPGNFSSWDTVSCYFSDPKYYNLTGNITYRNCVETGRNSSNCTFYSSSYQQATIEINGVMCSYGWCSLYGPSSINSNYSMSYDVYIGNCQEYSSTTYSPFYSTTYSPMTSSPSKVPPGNFSSWDTVSCYFSDPKYYNLTGNITYRNCVETGRNSSNCTFYSSSYQQATIEINGVMCSYGWCSLYGPSSINSNYSMSYDVYIGNCQEYSSNSSFQFNSTFAQYNYSTANPQIYNTSYSAFYSTSYSPNSTLVFNSTFPPFINSTMPPIFNTTISNSIMVSNYTLYPVSNTSSFTLPTNSTASSFFNTTYFTNTAYVSNFTFNPISNSSYTTSSTTTLNLQDIFELSSYSKTLCSKSFNKDFSCDPLIYIGSTPYSNPYLSICKFECCKFSFRFIFFLENYQS